MAESFGKYILEQSVWVWIVKELNVGEAEAVLGEAVAAVELFGKVSSGCCIPVAWHC